jgi:hypothetical protein
MNSVVPRVYSEVTPRALCGARSRSPFLPQNNRLHASSYQCVARGGSATPRERGV